MSAFSEEQVQIADRDLTDMGQDRLFKTCSNCGYRTDENFDFCPKCGGRL